MLPLVSHALTRRIEAAAATFMVGWLEGSRRRAGNPNGIDLVRFGGTVAASAGAAPDIDFMNCAYGLTPDDTARLPALLDHYRGRGVRPWFELAPAEGFEELATALSRGGAAQTGFHAAFYGAPPAGRATPRVADAAIRLVEEGDDEGRERFGQTLAAGHGVPAEHLTGAGEDARGRPHRAGWRLYLAEVDGRPAAAAALVPVDGIGYLANASTLPWARGGGLQTALIARRLADARAAGCELVASVAAFDGPSARNLQRAGLRLAYVAAEWRVRASA